MMEQVIDICLCEMSPATKIAGVPAFVCTRCDERIYSGEVSMRLGDIRERFEVREYDTIQPMLVYQFDSAPRQTQLTFSRDDERQMVGITTMPRAPSFVSHDADVKTEAPVQGYPGTADVA